MPLRKLPGADLDYYLVLFDSEGNERPEEEGGLLSEKLTDVVQHGVTDVFFFSHGWKGDVPGAIRQYDKWISVMAEQLGDRAQVRRLDGNFKPLIVGVHWPSLPWGDERVEAAVLGAEDPDGSDEFAAEQRMDDEELVHLYAQRIADTDKARNALETILRAAGDTKVQAQVAEKKLPSHLRTAYETLFTEAGLGLDGVAAAPGLDQQTFEPSRTMEKWSLAAGQIPAAPSESGNLLDGGLLDKVRDALLMPLRQLSFWAMKHRACHVGQTGAHALLLALQNSTQNGNEKRKPRFHLMGHSFGCIVVSAAVSGPLDGGVITSRLPRPVDSLFLVQGALSLWSFAEAIPYPPTAPGYFRPIALPTTLVSGPTVTTQSSFDRAVGTFFPLGAKVGGDRLLGEQLPEFGGVGAFGIQGTDLTTTHNSTIAHADDPFNPGHIYNIDASTVICNGGGPSGAHSDIAHPEIAHLFWRAVLAAKANA